MKKQVESAKQRVQTKGLVRTRDASKQGMSRMMLSRLAKRGDIVRVGHGIYSSAEYEPSEHASIAEVAFRASHGVICLLSALRLHDLTTQAPFEVWLGVGSKARAPKIDYPAIRVIRYTDYLLKEGIDTKIIDGVPVRVTNVARTVADCFKHRNKIGLDVALEALREAWDAKKVTMAELWDAAQLCRVANVMRPYLESLA